MRNNTLGRCLVRARRTGRDIIFRAVVFLTLALVAFGFSWYNANYKQENNPQQNPDDRRQRAEERVADYTFWLDLATFGLFASTLGLWVVTWRSGVNQSSDTRRSLAVARRAANAATEAAKAARDQLEHSQSALITTERAFVILEPFWHKKEVVNGIDGWSFRCIWKNVGKTPTKYMLMNFNRQWRIRAGTLPFDDPIILGELRFGILLLHEGKKRARLEQWFDAGVTRLAVCHGRPKQA